MASFGRARRAPGSTGGFVRPFAALLAVSLVLLLLRDTSLVRSGSAAATELLVPVERVLGTVGSTFGNAWQAVVEIQSLRDDNQQLHSQVDQLPLENVQLREQAFSQAQAAQLAAVAKALPFRTLSASVI